MDERLAATTRSVQLPPHSSSVSAARRFLRRVVTEARLTNYADTAELGVSELVTNALIHARSPVTVTVRTDGHGMLRIEVTDTAPVQPQPRNYGLTAATGRGLRILASLGNWGVEQAPGGRGKTVWFEPAPDDAGEAYATQGWATDLQEML